MIGTDLGWWSRPRTRAHGLCRPAAPAQCRPAALAQCSLRAARGVRFSVGAIQHLQGHAACAQPMLCLSCHGPSMHGLLCARRVKGLSSGLPILHVAASQPVGEPLVCSMPWRPCRLLRQSLSGQLHALHVSKKKERKRPDCCDCTRPRDAPSIGCAAPSAPSMAQRAWMTSISR